MTGYGIAAIYAIQQQAIYGLVGGRGRDCCEGSGRGVCCRLPPPVGPLLQQGQQSEGLAALLPGRHGKARQQLAQGKYSGNDQKDDGDGGNRAFLCFCGNSLRCFVDGRGLAVIHCAEASFVGKADRRVLGGIPPHYSIGSGAG